MSVFCDWNIFVSLTSNRFTYILYFKERNIYDLIHLLKKIHFCGYFIIGNYLTTVICYMFYCFVFPPSACDYLSHVMETKESKEA